MLAVLPFCLHAAVVVPSDTNRLEDYADSPRAGRAVALTGAGGNWAMLARMADECARDPDTTACVAVKAATALERAARVTGDVQLLPGLTLVQDQAATSQRDSRALPTEDELRSQLVQESAAEDHTTKVADMVINSGLRFLQSRTLQFKFPQTDSEQLSRAIEEGKLSALFTPTPRGIFTGLSILIHPFFSVCFFRPW